MDSAFSRVILLNPDADTFEIWRIKKLKLITISRASYGKFYDGDSYVIFNRRRGETHIHFWLGTYTSQDEATVAAYKTVELDNCLGGLPIQHREVQGYESKRFISYFKNFNGIYYLDGGFESGLNYYERSLLPKLFCIKGKREPMIIKQLGHHCWSEMNYGDVYVLEVRSKDKDDDVIFIWRGRSSNFYEKLNAAKLANILKEENASAHIVIMDDGTENSNITSQELEKFESVLPLKDKSSKLKDPSKVMSDEEVQKNGHKDKVTMYELESGKGDEIIITNLNQDVLCQSSLRANKAFVIDDHSGSGIWIWVGKDSHYAYNNTSMKAGQGFIKEKNYSPNTSITRVVQNAEPVEFRVFFKKWVPPSYPQKKIEEKPKTLPPSFDAKFLHKKPHLASHFRMVDDGSGDKEVYRIEKRELVPIPKEKHGSFYSGDCYLIFYSYEESNRPQYIIYYWLGSNSSQDERGTAALKAIELDDKYGGRPVQVRVVEGKEPPHLLSMFQGQFKILLGGISSMFDERPEGFEESRTSKGTLLQIHGVDQLRTRAIEVEYSASSLNTNDCFILTTKTGRNFIWFGKCSIGDEREMAKIYLTGHDFENIYEGLESEVFWNHLGGKKPYIQEKIGSYKYGSTYFPEPRLFHAKGISLVEEIFDFNQRDLIPEDVMLLDTGDCLYIWIGTQSSEAERKFVLKIAEEYLISDPTNRDLDLPIIIVKQGEEPSHFRGFFGSWDFAWFERIFL